MRRSPPTTPFVRQPPLSEKELLLRATALGGHSVAAVAAAVGLPCPPSSQRGKGFIGRVAEYALGADPLAGQRPDFPDLGIELKTIPVNDAGVPRESTFVCALSMQHADLVEFRHSVLAQRLTRVLWLPVGGPRSAPFSERFFKEAKLWSPDAVIWQQLQADFEELTGMVGVGLSGRISAHLGEILQLRPKAAHGRMRTWGPGELGPSRQLPLGFYLRSRFTRTLLAKQ